MSRYELPPMRQELPTLPFDLSEYARVYTGPAAQDPATGTSFPPPAAPSTVAALAVAAADERPESGIVSGELVTIAVSEAPRLLAKNEPLLADPPKPKRRRVAALTGRVAEAFASKLPRRRSGTDG